jgi:imidazolonepropionase-like amidohydrolase
MNGNNTRAGVCLAVALLLCAAAPQCFAGDAVLFQSIRVLTVSGPILVSVDVLIQDGKIARIGDGGSLRTSGLRVIQGEGLTLLPGLIDSKTHVGLIEISMDPATVDTNEKSSPATPHLLVADAINPESKVIPVTRGGGLTTVLVAPGENNVLGGQSALIHLTGESLEEMLIRSPVGVHATMGEAPKGAYRGRNIMPMSRMGVASLLREKLAEARDYMQTWERFRENEETWQRDKEGEVPSVPKKELDKEALIPVLEGERPLIVSVHRASDIEVALRIADEFDLEIVLDHATEGWKIADEIARRNVPVLLGPITVQPSSMQTLGARYDNAALLHEAGVTIAIQSGSTHNARLLPYEAGTAVAHGLPWEQALKAVTLNPAEIFGVDDRLGSIEEGKEATVIVIEGTDPFQPLHRLRHVFIRGVEYSAGSYQNTPRQ